MKYTTSITRTLVCVLCMFVCCLAQADPIRLSKARQFAQSYMAVGETPVLVQTKDFSPTGKRYVGGDLQQSIYIFSRGTDKGFVVVAGNDRLPQIIGFAEQGNFDYDDMPPALNDMLRFYALAADSLNVLQANSNISQANNPSSVLPLEGVRGGLQSPLYAAGTRNIAPLMTSHWHQSWPYNNRCPKITSNGNLAITGCVATAASQILYYWRRDLDDRTKYNTPTYGYGDAPVLAENMIPSGTPLKWDLMQDQYGKGETAEMQDAVAVLMATVGMSSWLTYGSSTGGQITDASNVMMNQFGMKGNVVHWKSSYSQSSWEKMIVDDLEAGYPILYAGQHPDQGGHAVVIDGYRVNDNLFHFNFGWGGQGDGYYTVNDETGMNGFTGYQGMAHKAHSARNRIEAELLEAPETMLCRTNNQLRVRITNRGTLPMSGIYVYCSTGKTPAGTAVSDKETIIGRDETVELTFQLRPAATNTYNIFVTDENKNILAEKPAVPTVNTVAKLSMTRVLCDDGVLTEKQTLEGEEQTVHLISNTKKVNLGFRLRNAEDATSCRPTFSAHYAKYDAANGTFGSDTKKSKNDVVLEPGTEEDVLFNFTALTDDVVYRVKLNLTAEGYGADDRIDPLGQDTVLYFRLIGPDLTAERGADDDITNPNSTELKLKGRYNSIQMEAIAAATDVVRYDMTEVIGLPSNLSAANPNALFYATAEQNVAGRNIVVDNVVETLDLTPGYNFIPRGEMTAMTANFHLQEGVGEYGTVYLPFTCDVPTGMFARSIHAVNLSTLKDVDSCNVELSGAVPYMIMTDKPRTLSAKNVAVSTTVSEEQASVPFHGTFVNTVGTSTNYVLDHADKQYFESARNKQIPAFTAYIEHDQHVNSISSQYRQKDNKSKELAALLVSALALEKSLPAAVYQQYADQLTSAIYAGEVALTTQPVLEQLTYVTAQLSELVSMLEKKVVVVSPYGYIDCTNLITNPSFETGTAAGWTRHNSQGRTTTTDAKVVDVTSSFANYMVGADGKNIMSLKKNARVFQTLEDVPNGTYDLLVSVAADETEQLSIFLNADTISVDAHPFGATYMTEIKLTDIKVTDHTITFGAISNANWAKVDHFRLHRTSTDEDETAIDDVIAQDGLVTTLPASRRGIYDLTGRRLSTTGSGLSTTGRGIYIINGKKVIK